MTEYQRRPWILYLVAALIYTFLFAPIALVIVNSFNANVLRTNWGGFTLHWYKTGWSDPTIVSAAKTSVFVAITVAVASTIIGTSTAIALRRSRRWTRLFLEGTTYARLIIPELVLALALLILFTRAGITRGVATIIIGHVVFNSAYVAVVVGARLAARDPATDEAARDLGATAFRAFRRVTLPEIMPGVLAGALLAFTFSLDNVVTSFFLSGSTNTLPLVILSLIRFQVSPVVNALGTSLVVANAICMTLFLIINWRRTVGRAAAQARSIPPDPVPA